MAVYRYEIEIGDDHQVTLPKEVPVGRAEIVVTPQSKVNADWERTKQVIHEMATGPFHTRTKEEIDAYIRRERESWE